MPIYVAQGSYDCLNMCIALALGILIPFILTMILFKDDKKENDALAEIVSPLSGEKIELEQVQDDAFSQGILGKGIGINPIDGVVMAPADGVVTALFPTLHAIGITTNQGVELLIHIGINTVELNGKYFKAFVKQGDKIKKGQKLLEFDMEKMKAEGYVMESPVIITNWDKYREISVICGNEIQRGEAILQANR